MQPLRSEVLTYLLAATVGSLACEARSHIGPACGDIGGARPTLSAEAARRS
jgi:hypothetical protein